MAVILFKKGGFKICDENSFQHELDNGWFLNKEEAEADWASNLPKDEKPEVKKPKINKDALIEKLKARKAELIAEQNKE